MIELRGVRVHNLKDVDVAFPLGRLTVVTGVSGAGKSSLVFETLHAEAQRRYLQSFSVSTRQFLERFDQPDADSIGDLPPAIAIRPALTTNSDGTVDSFTDLDELLAQFMAEVAIPTCAQCNREVRRQSAHDVAHTLQALPAGTRITIAFPDRPAEGETPDAWTVRLREEGWVRLDIAGQLVRLDDANTLPAIITGLKTAEPLILVDRLEIGTATAERIYETIETTFRRGDGRLVASHDANPSRFDNRWRCPDCNLSVAEPEQRLFDCHDPLGACLECHGSGLKKNGQACPSCQGRRFNARALSVHWQGRNIADLLALPLHALHDLLRPTTPETPTAAVRAEMSACLALLAELNLSRLPLDRPLAVLATGERQRLHLSRALASNLVNALYLFEEPSAGLHAVDVARMVPKLLALRDLGNTVVIIDHHPEVMRIADHVVDVGPGAGEEGGRIVYQGPLEGMAEIDESVTADYFFPGRLADESPRRRREKHGELHLRGVTLPPLVNFDVHFPLGVLCVVTGVSGAGKSRLVRDALFHCLAKAKGKKAGIDTPPGCEITGAGLIEDVVLMDQSPPTRSTRSNPATSLKFFDDIRELFAQTADAKIRNFDPGAFSFNQPGGRCETCEGQGRLSVDMHFLPDVAVTCPECLGKRYRKEILQIKVRGLDISEVLDLTVREAFRFFRAQRSLEKKMKWLLDVGLDYLRLGQPLETLSGGEAQRLKLAGHLASSRKPRTLFLLLEPTRGLHPADVADLLTCFDHLLDTGHSLIVVDYHVDVLSHADHVIELHASPHNF